MKARYGNGAVTEIEEKKIDENCSFEDANSAAVTSVQ